MLHWIYRICVLPLKKRKTTTTSHLEKTFGSQRFNVTIFFVQLIRICTLEPNSSIEFEISKRFGLLIVTSIYDSFTMQLSLANDNNLLLSDLWIFEKMNILPKIYNQIPSLVLGGTKNLKAFPFLSQKQNSLQKLLGAA